MKTALYLSSIISKYFGAYPENVGGESWELDWRRLSRLEPRHDSKVLAYVGSAFGLFQLDTLVVFLHR
jgi:hypothetical protein